MTPRSAAASTSGSLRSDDRSTAMCTIDGMKRSGRRPAQSLGVIAAASVVVSQFAPAMALAGASSADGSPAPRSSSDDHDDDDTTLETCVGYFGGRKVPVGFFDDVSTDSGVFNRIRSGGRRELEYRIEDLDQNCVIGDPTVVITSSNEVSCSNPAEVLRTDVGTFSAPEYDDDDRHFEQYWTAPRGKNRCYVVVVNSLTALFRTR